MKTDRLVLTISAAIFVLLLVLAIFVVRSVAISINLVFIGILVLTVPFSIFKFLQFRKTKAYEKEFPNFLRDLAESQRAGLTVLQAIRSVAKAEYGLLTNEIRKIDKELSWNVSFDKVLKKFAERMSDSKIIARSTMIINQASKSGGNVEETMESLASNIEQLREVQEEKAALLNQQVIMMYAIFFIFLGVTLSLIKFLVPILQTQNYGGGAGGVSSFGFGGNPCGVCVNSPDPACFGCNAFFGISAALDFGPPQDPSAYYKSLFFAMILVQGFFSGLIAGQISTDSVVAGVKHSMVMLFAGFSIFVLTIKLGLV